MSDVYLSRHISADWNPEYKHFTPVWSSESVREGEEFFGVTSAMPMPTTLELLRYYPAPFVGYIESWVSNITRYLCGFNKR